MCAYSISVSNGKIVGDSAFYILANDALSKECSRLSDLTDALEKDAIEKKKRIAEYKCAKYRYASLSLIHSILQNNNRCRKLHNIGYSHYLLSPFDEIFKKHADYLILYEAAPEEEKPDYSLYYAIIAFAQEEIKKLESEIQNATDWERVELEERIGGLKVAKDCLDEAWQKRKEVVQ